MQQLQVTTLVCDDQQSKIGQLTLNHPKALNALTLDMVCALTEQLEAWQNDASIVAVFLNASSAKAFCAGGDVVGIQQALAQDKQSDLPKAFFTHEYALNQLMHEYPKPIICWGNGIVMGGGMGLFCSASDPVVTENSMLAMPEVSIGLYPDVAASWFLNRLPRHFAEFLAMTGYRMSGADAFYVGLAHRMIASDQEQDLLTALRRTQWQAGEPSVLVKQLLKAFDIGSDLSRESLLKTHEDQIRAAMDTPIIAQKVNQVLSGEGEVFARAKPLLAAASPLAVVVSLSQLERSRHWSLTEVLRSELALSLKCCEYGEFSEGVRALLVDKDKAPQWRFDHVDAVPADVLAWFFSS